VLTRSIASEPGFGAADQGVDLDCRGKEYRVSNPHRVAGETHPIEGGDLVGKRLAVDRDRPRADRDSLGRRGDVGVFDLMGNI
jgi:hypothetical protein